MKVRRLESMYAGLDDYPVAPGNLDEAIRVWREEVLPTAEEQPGYRGALLMVDPEKNKMVGVGLWDSKEAADAFGAGVWRSGSELRDKIDALLAGEVSREELDVRILHMPTSP
jgi:heme-degrading monooxygenase HmoA